MKSKRLLFIVGALIAAGGVAVPAYAQAPTPSENTGTEGTLGPGMAINAELNSSLDSKKVKPGDPVTARATEAVKSSDGRTILPKGAKLVGRVTQAKSRSKGDQESMLALQFDKAMLKEGQAVALSNVTIQAMAPPAISSPTFSAGQPDTTTGAPTAPGSNSPTNPSMSGSRGARPAPGTNESPYPNTGAEAGGPNALGPLPANSKGVYGIEGLRLGVAASGNGETSVITSAGKNVHLDGGTRLLLVPSQQASAGPASR